MKSNLNYSEFYALCCERSFTGGKRIGQAIADAVSFHVAGGDFWPRFFRTAFANQETNAQASRADVVSAIQAAVIIMGRKESGFSKNSKTMCGGKGGLNLFGTYSAFSKAVVKGKSGPVEDNNKDVELSMAPDVLNDVEGHLWGVTHFTRYDNWFGLIKILHSTASVGRAMDLGYQGFKRMTKEMYNNWNSSTKDSFRYDDTRRSRIAKMTLSYLYNIHAANYGASTSLANKEWIASLFTRDFGKGLLSTVLESEIGWGGNLTFGNVIDVMREIGFQGDNDAFGITSIHEVAWSPKHQDSRDTWFMFGDTKEAARFGNFEKDIEKNGTGFGLMKISKEYLQISSCIHSNHNSIFSKGTGYGSFPFNMQFWDGERSAQKDDDSKAATMRVRKYLLLYFASQNRHYLDYVGGGNGRGTDYTFHELGAGSAHNFKKMVRLPTSIDAKVMNAQRLQLAKTNSGLDANPEMSLFEEFVQRFFSDAKGRDVTQPSVWQSDYYIDWVYIYEHNGALPPVEPIKKGKEPKPYKMSVDPNNDEPEPEPKPVPPNPKPKPEPPKPKEEPKPNPKQAPKYVPPVIRKTNDKNGGDYPFHG